MKKIIFVLALICVAGTSCKKAQENNITTATPLVQQSGNGNANYQDIVNKIKERSDKYRQLSGNANPHATGFWSTFIKVLEVAVADVAGAMGGAEIGGVPGAIIGGAACSVAEALTLVVPAGNGGTVGGGPTGGPANSANAYDYVGYWHYKIVDKALNNPSLVSLSPYTTLDQPLYYGFATNELVSNGVYLSAPISYATFQSIYSYAMTGLSTYSSFPDYTQAMVTSGYMAPTEKLILDDYLDVMESYATSTSPGATSGFIAYSVIVEGDITSSALPGIMKQHLLSVMSSCRWGLAYWK